MTRDQFLTEKIERHVTNIRNNFSTPKGFFKLWDWAKEQEWWNDFWNDIFCNASDEYKYKTTNISHPNGFEMSHGYFWQRYFTGEFGDSLIDPTRFADAVARYLGWKEE